MKLADRMKAYESPAHHHLIRRVPVMVRVDGRAFHTFTGYLNKPFDDNFMQAMVQAAYDVASDMQGFRVAYVQSDEVTFCMIDYEQLETMGWFAYDLSKIVSITASMMSVAFNKHFGPSPTKHLPVFDGRAFNLPHNEVVNAFLWRARDWNRNSVHMLAREHFSPKELHGVKQWQVLTMLEATGNSWENMLSKRQKNGTFIYYAGGELVVTSEVLPTFKDINFHIGHLFDYPEYIRGDS